ncbi:MAG: hypothetical protein JWQ65_1956 [Devosia sp.]|nr:hypothetical protein [Devosia sp.]
MSITPNPAFPFVRDRLHSVRGERVPEKMLYPSLDMIAAKLLAIPAGKRIDLIGIRADMAREYDASSSCPVTTQRHMKAIAAETVAAMQDGKASSEVVPFWRALDPERPGTARYAGGAEFVRARLAEDR